MAQFAFPTSTAWEVHLPVQCNELQPASLPNLGVLWPLVLKFNIFRILKKGDPRFSQYLSLLWHVTLLAGQFIHSPLVSQLLEESLLWGSQLMAQSGHWTITRWKMSSCFSSQSLLWCCLSKHIYNEVLLTWLLHNLVKRFVKLKD